MVVVTAHETPVATVVTAAPSTPRRIITFALSAPSLMPTAKSQPWSPPPGVTSVTTSDCDGGVPVTSTRKVGQVGAPLPRTQVSKYLSRSRPVVSSSAAWTSATDRARSRPSTLAMAVSTCSREVRVSSWRNRIIGPGP